MPHLHTCHYILRQQAPLGQNCLLPEKTRLLPQTGDWRSQIIQLPTATSVLCYAMGGCSRSNGIHGGHHLLFWQLSLTWFSFGEAHACLLPDWLTYYYCTPSSQANILIWYILIKIINNYYSTFTILMISLKQKLYNLYNTVYYRFIAMSDHDPSDNEHFTLQSFVVVEMWLRGHLGNLWLQCTSWDLH